MVTLQAKQQQQPQHPHPPRRQHSREQEAAVVEEDCWNRRQRNRENGDIPSAECNGTQKVDDDWRLQGCPINGLQNNNNKQADNRSEQIVAVKENSSSGLVNPGRRVNGDVAGSNSESTQCSDLEEDDEGEKELELAEEEEEEEDNEEEEDDEDGDASGSERSDRWIRRKVVTTRVQQDDTSFDGNDGQTAAVLPNLDDTTFGQVCITNSRHVHVGNTNFYKGPVTIKQFVYTNAYPVQDKEDGALSNQIDANYTGRVSDINPNDVPAVKGDPNGPILPTYREYDKVTKWLWTWRCAAILCVLALSLVTIVTVVSVLLSRDTAAPPKVTLPDSPTSGSDPDDELVDSVRFIEREGWGAQPPSATLTKLKQVPAPYVIISHTASLPCTLQSECVYRVRVAQTLHIESFGWDDIGYNFLVGGDGLAYVGRGWDSMGAHAFGWNDKSIGISFIGTFNDIAPTRKQLHAAQKVIEFGVKLKKISPTYKLLGHRQVSRTLSPGDELYKILTTWEHWSPTPAPLPNRASNTNYPHPAATIPIVLLILPYVILIFERLSRFIFEASLGFVNKRFLPSFIIYDKIVE